MRAITARSTNMLKDLTFPLYASNIVTGLPIYFRAGTIADHTGEEVKNIFMYNYFKDIVELSENYNTTFQGILTNSYIPVKPKQVCQIDMLNFINKEDTHQILPDNIKFYCYDIFDEELENPTYRHRLIKLEKMLTGLGKVELVTQDSLKDFKELELYLQASLARGFEGIVIRDINGKYVKNHTAQSTPMALSACPNLKLKPEFIYIAAIEEIVSEFLFEQGNVLTEVASYIVTYREGAKFKLSLKDNDPMFNKHLWDYRNYYKGKTFVYKGIVFPDSKVPKYTRFIKPIIT
jgi:hypothetical protein